MSTPPPTFVTATEVVRESIDWLVPGLIPQSKFSLLVGEAGVGKTTLVLDLLAKATVGDAMPYGCPRSPANVLILNAEDGLGDTLRPRLEEAGANLARVRMLDCNHGSLALPRDIHLLKQEIRQFDARMVMIDPVASFVGKEINSDREDSVRRLLIPLELLAHECPTTIIGIRHLNKKTDVADRHRVTGSAAFLSVPRSVVHATKDPKHPGLCLLKSLKANLSRDPRTLGYELVESDDPDHPVVKWRNTVEREVAPTISRLDAAADWLSDLLADGPRLSIEIDDEAKAAEHKPRTVRRAKEQIGVVARKGLDGRSSCSLPVPTTEFMDFRSVESIPDNTEVESADSTVLGHDHLDDETFWRLVKS